MTTNPYTERRRFTPMQWFVGMGIAAPMVFGVWSANRAWVQVRSLDLEVPAADVQPGWAPRLSVVTSGRATVTVVLTLTQGAHTDTISMHTINPSRDGFWDPRFISRTFNPRVTPGLAGRLVSGRAVLRAEAHGRPQWLRTPAPVIREVPVMVVARS
jgi:hypothetical protein